METSTHHFASKPKTKLTANQFEVLRLVVVGNPGSSDPSDFNCDIDQVLERLSRQTTKQALQFTIRSLVHNGMMVKVPRVQRRGRLRVTFEATEIGKAIAGDRKPQPVFIEPESESI